MRGAQARLRTSTSCTEVVMATPRGCLIDGKKFMWDGKEYESKEDAEKAAGEYATEKFETRIVEENDTVHVYTRRVVTEIVLEGAPPT